MKIILPENISEITLGAFQKHAKVLEQELTEDELKKHKVSIFTGIKLKDIPNLINKDFEDLSNQIDIALNTEAPFKERFFIDDIEFGFIPNFDKIAQKEWVDFSLYPVSDFETYHNLMAILFRPVKQKDKFNNYTISNYKGTDNYANIMKLMPMNIVNASIVFFCSLAKDLQDSTQKYMQEAQLRELKQATTLKSGDGILL